jgi:hypothetical protein
LTRAPGDCVKYRHFIGVVTDATGKGIYEGTIVIGNEEIQKYTAESVDYGRCKVP